MKRRITFAVLGALLLATLPAAAQFVQVIPPNPTPADNVLFHFDGASPYIGGNATRVGNAIRVDLLRCFIICAGPVGTFDVPVGQLPAGTYTYEVYDDDGVTLVASGSFHVGERIPTLSEAMILALIALLAIAGVVTMSRYNFL